MGKLSASLVVDNEGYHRLTQITKPPQYTSNNNVLMPARLVDAHARSGLQHNNFTINQGKFDIGTRLDLGGTRVGNWRELASC
jgi:hypothetical protein